MEISVETFLREPSKFIDEGVVIIKADEYQKQMELLETLKDIKESEEDFAVGRTRTHEEVFSMLEKRAKELIK